jgi:hypothetical protein
MTIVAFFVVVSSLVALLVVGTEDMGSGHTVFANRAFSGHVTFTNRGINVQTETNQDQGCESVGGTSGITNACTATSGRGSTQTSTETQVALFFNHCLISPGQLTCNDVVSCNNIGCTSVTCETNNPVVGTFNCITESGVQLTSCTLQHVAGPEQRLPCTLTKTGTVPGTGITQSGGVSGDGGT